MDTTSTTPAEEDSQVVDPAEEQSTETASTETTETPFDPNSISEELKPAYKAMQADYTKKTQAIAEERKQIESLKAQAEQFKKFEKYTPILEEMLGSENQQQPTNPEMEALAADLKKRGYSDEAIEMMKVGAGFVLNSINQKQTLKEREVAFQSQVQEAAKIDTRLTDPALVYQTDDGEQVSYGRIVESIVATMPNWQQNVVESTKKAIKLVDALIAKERTQGKTELSASAKQKAAKFPNLSSSPNQGAAIEVQPKSMKEAAALAKEQLGMK